MSKFLIRLWLFWSIVIIATPFVCLMGYELTASPARAAIDTDCTPKTWRTPSGTGSSVVSDATSTGAFGVYWCPADPPPNGDPALSWFVIRGQVGLYSVIWDKLPAASGRVATAADPWAQYKTERAALQFTPADGTVQACDFANLKRAACVALLAAGLPGYPPNKAEPELSAYCGAVQNCTPPPPPPPTDTYRTPKSGTFTVYTAAGGKLVSVVSGKKAPADALADCGALKATSGSSVYCSFPGAGSNEVTYVIKVSS